METPLAQRLIQFDALLQRVILFGLHALVLVTPFLFTWVNDELFEFNKMLFVYAITWTVLAAWAARACLAKRPIFRRTPFDIPVVLFIISQLLSTLLSLHPRTSWLGYYTRFHGGLLSTLTYAGLYWAATTHLDLRKLRSLLGTAVIASIGVTLYALPEHFGHSPSCLLMSNGASFDAQCWQQDVQARIFGTFGQPNWLAAYLVMTIPLVLGVAWPTWQARRVLQSIGYILAIFLALATLYFTGSRSGLLGLAAAVGVSIVWLAWYAYQRRWWTPVGAIVVAGLVGMLITRPYWSNIAGESWQCFTQSETFFNQVRSTYSADSPSASNSLETGGTDSGVIRCIVWTGAVRIWQRYPLFGSGVETFAYSYYQDRPVEHNFVSEWDFLYNKAHNEFLNFLATTGIVGLGSYLVLLGVPLAVATRTLQRSPDSATTPLTLAASAAIVGVSVSNFFGFSTVMVNVLLFICFAIIAITYREKNIRNSNSAAAIDEKNLTTLSAFQYIALALIGLAVLFGWISIWKWWSADYSLTLGKRYLAAGYTYAGLTSIENAVLLEPREPVFLDELATTYGLLAAGLAEQNEATSAAALAENAEIAAATVQVLNPYHVNYYKSRAQLYTILASLDQTYLDKAAGILETATGLAPSDAKLRYNLGLIKQKQQRYDEAAAELQRAIELKPNYLAAYETVADVYAAQAKWPEAIAQYDFILNRLTPGEATALAKRAELVASQSAQTAK